MPALAVADALARATFDPPQLLDIDVEQLAGTAALIAPRRLEPEAAELAQPDPGQDPGHRRLWHPQQLRDLRAREAQPPQRRDRLDALLRRAVVDRLRRRGAIEQTSSPSARRRRTHSPARRSLTSAAAAASASDHPSSTTLRQSNSRFFRLSAALRWSFIRCPPWTEWLRHLSASKEARMNNVLRDYTGHELHDRGDSDDHDHRPQSLW
jgi:hypothetical protein